MSIQSTNVIPVPERNHRIFLGSALEAYKTLHHLSNQDLALFLKLPLPNLEMLAKCKRPHTKSKDRFDKELADIVTKTCVNGDSLAWLLCAVSYQEANRDFAFEFVQPKTKYL